MISNTDRYRPRITPTVGRLSGKVALVTGGASGIRRAIALRFAQEGADIASPTSSPAERRPRATFALLVAKASLFRPTLAIERRWSI